MSTIIAIANQKGGVGKTTTTVNLGIGLADVGKRVLLVDSDAQASLTESLGYTEPDQLDVTLSTLMQKAIEEQPIADGEGILHHAEGVDLVPANIELSGMETALVNIMNRERALKTYLDSVKKAYDYVLIDCTPSLGMLTINALAAADEVIVPVQAQYLPAKGLEQLIMTIGKVRRQINPALSVAGILMTMVDRRTNFAKEVSRQIRQNFSERIPVFKTEIPLSVRAAETSAVGKSIYTYDRNGKAAKAYIELTKEVLEHGGKRRKSRSEIAR